ncbi:MAG: choice-of-anchor P family protein [Nocardioides sp.]
MSHPHTPLPRRQAGPDRARRAGRSLAVLAVVGLALPLGGTAPAHAAADPAYSGYSTVAQASPVKIEVYEPTIPIPANPQGEVELGYSHVEADTGSAQGRASYLWPGDAVGEGFKTIVENLGLPDQVSGPLAAQGYPVQVNSTYPSDQQSQADEPFPGMVMRTSASEGRTTAQTGYSTDCQVDPAQPSGGGGGGGGGGVPGVPGLPPLPSVPGLPPLPVPGAKPSGQASPQAHARASSGKAAADDTSCQLPAQLAALVDFGGYVSSSSSSNDGTTVGAKSRSALTDVELLGGVITVSGVHATSLASSDGRHAVPAGRAGYGTLAIAGQEFTIGPDGIRGHGQSQPIPGLPDQPAKALEALGVQITVPKPAYTHDGEQATSDVAALVVTIDTHQLRSKLDGVPFDQIVGAVPDQAGQLKSLLGAAVHLSPKFVITLGDATTSVNTVQGISFPTPTATPPAAGGTSGGTSGSSGATSGGSSTGVGSAPAAGAPAGSSAPAAGTLTDAAPAGAGLPPLYSLPGALLFGGIGLAAAGGTWLRKIGLLALGGAGSCPHGLDSGLPDLRKA